MANVALWVLVIQGHKQSTYRMGCDCTLELQATTRVTAWWLMDSFAEGALPDDRNDFLGRMQKGFWVKP